MTVEGRALARVIRQHFSDLDDFRESMAGRPATVRIGGAASVLEWMVLPKLGDCRAALGEVIIELEQSRTTDIVRGVADGRLDFGVVRDDAVPAGMKRWKLGKIGYGLFAFKKAWGDGIEGVVARTRFAELLPGGSFHRSYQTFLADKGWKPQVVARAGSFLSLARLVDSGGLAAVLPLTAAVEFDASRIKAEPLPWDHRRTVVLLANPRSIERAGLRAGAAKHLAAVLAWEGGSS